MSTDTKYPSSRPEVWGGIECTINRVQDHFRDQLQDAGHYTQPGDIARFAALGIRRLRYPVLWERHQPLAGQPIDWAWTSRQLDEIRSCGIAPIAGLLHHGSGPAHTDLLDKEFSVKLAGYAALVAARFPWLEYYTPVNEPLTTARFSGLYGLWYPHKQDNRSFLQMLINQVKGTVLSMQAIRRINPAARLVQTEDLSKVHSTPLLAYQAAYENERRWLTNDLLCGRVDDSHYFYPYFIGAGITSTELQFFLDNTCPPDIIGFNYYVTSERYLDERTENYPSCTHGGNGTHLYADTEAVRATEPAGFADLVQEAWHRYGIPMAITECHLNCTREEQLRWFREIWDAACGLNERGITVLAVTAWALLGSYDWDSLLTCNNGHYEPGVFDIRTPTRRPTAVARLVHSLATGGVYDHPLLPEKGWWHKCRSSATNMNDPAIQKAPPLLITGRNGTLGQAFIKICERRSVPYVALTHQELDIVNDTSIDQAIDTWRPWAVINTAGYVRVDDAETDSDECFAVNATGPGLLAAACRRKGLRFMSFSSDLVFDGSKNTPYHEADHVNPLNIYGASKAKGEQKIQAADASALIIRTSAFFGPWDRYNFAYHVLQTLQNNEALHVSGDVMVSPTYVPDLANTALDLLIDEEEGIWHLSNEGMLTWADFARNIAEQGGCTAGNLVTGTLEEMGWKAKRPLYSVLESAKGVRLPSLDNALHRYFRERML
ncbi:MAG: dTDP-4-dehydrorhamnose reductase [Chitinophagaceae bacterium]